MRPDDARRADARDWLSKAAADLRGAAIDLAATPPLLEDALIHYQLAVERALKGLLTWRDEPFRKTLRGVNYSCRSTTRVVDRLAAHNAGLSPHTARYRPWKVLAAIEFADSSQARAFERYLKSGSGRAFARRHFR